MAVKVIGLVGLATGIRGSLNAYFVDGQGDDPAITDKMVAVSFVQGDAVYHHIAHAGSGADENIPHVIKPLYSSLGVPYEGDLRWVLHKCTPLIEDGINEGDIIRWNAETRSWESCAEPFNFDQINLRPAGVSKEDVEGGVFYKGADKSIYICTEGE